MGHKVSSFVIFLVDNCAGLRLVMQISDGLIGGAPFLGFRNMNSLWTKMYAVKGAQFICVRLAYVQEGREL